MYQLTMSKEFDYPRERLFNAWKKPEVLRKWFAPGNMHVEEAEMDFQVGGKYRIVMQNPEGQQFIVGGNYLEIDETRRLTFSWKWETSPNTTRVELDFAEVSNKACQLTLVHSEFLEEPERDRHGDGWVGLLDKLWGLHSL